MSSHYYSFDGSLCIYTNGVGHWHERSFGFFSMKNGLLIGLHMKPKYLRAAVRELADEV